LLTTDDVGETAVTTPLTSVLGSAESVTVAGCPTAILEASDSAKLATTSRLLSPWIVMKLEEELDEDDPEPDELVADELPPAALPPLEAVPPVLPPLDEPDELLDEEDELDPVEALVDDPEPLTVSPTELLTEVTVPLISATSVVPARAFWSAVTVTWS
jgi:hypothetical protein